MSAGGQANQQTTPATPVCGCHGELMTWQADRSSPRGGRWVCRAKRREYNQRRAAQRMAWIRAAREDINYRIEESLTRRRRDLRAQRGRVLEKLSHLSEEAKRLESQQGPQEPTQAESDPPSRVHPQAAARKD